MPLITDLLVSVNDSADALARLTLPYFQKKKTVVISVGTAAVLTFLYTALQKMNRPPPKLRHLPYVGYFSFLNYIFRDALFETYSRKAIMPLAKQSNGIYMVNIQEEEKKTRKQVRRSNILTSETHRYWMGC